MLGSLPESVQHQVLNNLVDLALMFSLLLFMVMAAPSSWCATFLGGTMSITWMTRC